MGKRQGNSPVYMLADVVVKLVALVIFSALWCTYLVLKGRSADWDWDMEERIQATLWVYREGVSSLFR